jgi:hypothetical protein
LPNGTDDLNDDLFVYTATASWFPFCHLS